MGIFHTGEKPMRFASDRPGTSLQTLPDRVPDLIFVNLCFSTHLGNFQLFLEISIYVLEISINSKNTLRTDLSRCARKITMLDKSLPCNLALMSDTIEKTRNFLSNQTENICHNEKDNGAIAYRSSL
jgi:hypothetical protein